MTFFNITVLIKHPDIDTGEISRELKLDPFRSWNAGDNRKSPKDTPLSGKWSYSSWSHVFRFKKDEADRLVSEELSDIVSKLHEKRKFLSNIVDTEGRVTIYVQLPGTFNIAGELDYQTLKMISELKAKFGFEVYPNWDHEHDEINGGKAS